MRVNVNNNVIAVITDISLEVAKKNLIDPVIYDDKKNPIYKIEVNPGGKGALSKFGLVANTISEEGNLAVVIVEEMGITLDEIKQKYGKAIIAAKQYCPLYANAAAEAQAAIDEAFA